MQLNLKIIFALFFVNYFSTNSFGQKGERYSFVNNGSKFTEIIGDALNGTNNKLNDSAYFFYIQISYSSNSKQKVEIQVLGATDYVVELVIPVLEKETIFWNLKYLRKHTALLPVFATYNASKCPVFNMSSNRLPEIRLKKKTIIAPLLVFEFFGTVQND